MGYVNEDPEEIEVLAEAEDQLKKKIESTLSQLKRFNEQQQAEILDNSEALLLKALRNNERIPEGLVVIYSRMESKESLIAPEFRNPQADLIRQLIMVHKERRSKKAARFSLKQEYMSHRAQLHKDDRMSATFQQHLEMHQKAIRKLQKFYDLLEHACVFMDVNYDLIALDQQIADLYDIAVSFVIAGLISVGKSTVVNSLVGQTIAPQRNDTMTAIPIRYVNDATMERPLMLLPFFHQLNETAEEIRNWLNSTDSNAVIRRLKKQHLRDLAQQILTGYKFEPKYEGYETVLQASTQVHDFFRLAVDESFPEHISQFLPSSWSERLDSYLTVYTRFPGLEMATGLVNLSIVDTPGVDEYGVEKLNLQKVIEDAISVGNYAVLVSTVTDYAAESLEPLRYLFYTAKKLLKIPAMVFITHDEGIAAADRPAVTSNIAQSLNYVDEQGTHHTVFEQSDVFLVSARRMDIGARMKHYIKEHQDKPAVDDPKPEARRLASDWIDFVAYGIDKDEKTENYRDQSATAIEKRAIKLIEVSNMQPPVNRMVDAALLNAIPLTVGTALQRGTLLANILMERLEVETRELNQEELKKAEEEARRNLQTLKNARQELSRQLKEEGNSIKRRIDEDQRLILTEIKAVFESALPESAPKKPFTTRLIDWISRCKSPKAITMLKSKLPLEFDSKDEIQEAYLELVHAMKMSMNEYLTFRYREVPEELKKWSLSKKREIEAKMRQMAHAYEVAFKLGPTNHLVNDISLADGNHEDKDEEQLPRIQFSYQKRKKYTGEDLRSKKSKTLTTGFKKIFRNLGGKGGKRRPPLQNKGKGKEKDNLAGGDSNLSVEYEEEDDDEDLTMFFEGIENDMDNVVLTLMPNEVRNVLYRQAEQLLDELLTTLIPQVDNLIIQIVEAFGKRANREIQRITAFAESRLRESKERRLALEAPRNLLKEKVVKLLQEFNEE